MRSTRRLSFFFLMVGVSFPVAGHAQATAPEAWMETWASSQQIPEPQNALPAAEVQDVTIRETFHISAAGAMIRLRLSNAFGTEPLEFTAVHVARQVAVGSAAIVPGSDTAVMFSGAAAVTVPAGAEYWSDPVAYPVAALSSVTASFHLATAPAAQ